MNDKHDGGIESMLLFLMQNQREDSERIRIIKEKVKTIKLKQDKLLKLLKEIKKMASQGFIIMEEKVAELKTVNDSILALITTLANNVANSTTLEEAQQIVAEVEAEKVRLLEAINTPGPVVP